MIEFKTVNQHKILLTGADELINKATEVMGEISGGIKKEYDDLINDNLFNIIFCRIVSSEYFKRGNKIPNDLNFITISTSVFGKRLTFSIGQMPTAEKQIKYVDGVLYD